MDIIAVLSFIKTLSPLEAVLISAVTLIAASQGWLVFKGFKLFKKKQPTICVAGRAGQCELLRMQMDMAEENMEKVTASAMSSYLDMRAKVVGDNIILANDIESFCYDLTLYRVGQNIKNEIRSFFIANHLADMDENAFEIYMRRRTDQIIITMTNLMDKLYFPGSDPNRRELYEYNQTVLMPVFHHAMEATLRNGRQLAIQFKHGELDKYMERTNGNC